jgi:hypothetical protein
MFVSFIINLQKRHIIDADKTARSIDLFNALNWVPSYREAYINRCAIVSNRINGNCPPYINDLLILINCHVSTVVK